MYGFKPAKLVNEDFINCMRRSNEDRSIGNLFSRVDEVSLKRVSQESTPPLLTIFESLPMLIQCEFISCIS